ncbi:MAG: hypothetical protein EOM28_08285 [Clostridia bacterium]|nr:hypothetical protein [Clostridia bacterium]
MEISRKDMEDEVSKVAELLGDFQKIQATCLPADTEEVAAEEMEKVLSKLCRYLSEKLFSELGIPCELASFVEFKDVAAYKDNVIQLAYTIDGIKKRAFNEGVNRGGEISKAMEEKDSPEPVKLIAEVMGVKTPKIFSRIR